jgi:hypothetical protein
MLESNQQTLKINIHYIQVLITLNEENLKLFLDLFLFLFILKGLFLLVLQCNYIRSGLDKLVYLCSVVKQLILELNLSLEEQILSSHVYNQHYNYKKHHAV